MYALPSLLSALAVLLYFASAPEARAADSPTVGMVSKVQNQAKVGSETAVVGTLVHMNDTLHTGAEARLLVTFRDKTELTLGENATVVIDRYVFNPDASTGELALKTGVAAFRLATGTINKMRNKKIEVSTPVAALAVRGTDFWWGPIDGVFGVLLVNNSKLDVKNDEGAVTLDKAGYGTDIEQGLSKKKAPGGPGRPYKWPPDKVARALSQTNFGPTGPGLPPPGLIIPPIIAIPPIVTPPPERPPPRSP
jgi:FecR protein